MKDMFEEFERAASKKRPRWVYGVFAGVVGFQGILLLGLLAQSWWHIDKLEMPKQGVALAIAAPPPAQPPARKGTRTKAKTNDTKKIIKHRTEDVTQPVTLSEPVALASEGSETVGVPNGSITGVATSTCVGPSCDPNGPLSGVVEPPEFDPCKLNPASCKQVDRVIDQVTVSKQRIAGDTDLRPTRETKLMMLRDKKQLVIATVKMCITKTGAVRSLKLLKSTGYAAYDQKLLGKMRSWRYSAFKVNGQPTPVCTGITIKYRFKR